MSLSVTCLQVVAFLNSCQHPEGGYGGGPGQLAHLAPTYAAVSALLTLGGEDALGSIDRFAGGDGGDRACRHRLYVCVGNRESIQPVHQPSKVMAFPLCVWWGGGGAGEQLADLAPTYAAVSALLTLGVAQALCSIDRCVLIQENVRRDPGGIWVSFCGLYVFVCVWGGEPNDCLLHSTRPPSAQTGHCWCEMPAIVQYLPAIGTVWPACLQAEVEASTLRDWPSRCA